MNRFMASIATLSMLALAVSASAQAPNVTNTVVERLRQVEQERRTGLASTENYLRTTGSGRRLEGAGAWFTDTLIDFSDDDKNSRQPDLIEFLQIRDLRGWYTTQIGDKWGGYFRVRFQDFDFDTNLGLPKPNLNIVQKGDLDMGYIDYRPDPSQRYRAGRQFLAVGRGYVLAEILDAFQYSRTSNGLTLSAFYGTTPNRVLNIDASIIGFNQGGTRRNFGALEGSYTHRSGNRYWAYHMSQVDDSESTSAAQRTVDFHLNTNYTGIGTSYKILPRVNMFMEGVLEGGSTFTDAQRRVDIEASFITMLMLWTPKGANDPLAQFEYGHGSGDDKRASVTDTFGGKRDATTDENFLYFGRLETGVALSPRISNLHMFRLGYQERIRLRGPGVRATDPLLGVKVTEYYKEHQAGAISDPLANGPGKHVGNALDAYVAWRVFSDTAINFQAGHFKPGNAYPIATRSATDRYILSTTLSF